MTTTTYITNEIYIINKSDKELNLPLKLEEINNLNVEQIYNVTV